MNGRFVRWFVLLCALTAGLIAVVGCSRSGSSVGSKTTNTSDEHRLVVLSPAVAVMLRDLGLADLIVGKHDYDLVLPDTVPAVGHQEALDYEAILGAAPTEIIIEWGSRPLPPRLTEFAESHGWEIRRVTLLTIDDIARTVDDLAIGFGAVRFETGGPGVSGLSPEGLPGDLDRMAEPLQFRDPSVRFGDELPSATLARAWSPRGDGFEGIGPVLLLGSTTPPGVLGPGSFHDQILRRIGGVPAIDEGSPWMELAAEDIYRLDPAAIVLIAPRDPGSAYGTDVSAAALLNRLGRVGTLDVEAVRSGRIAIIDDPLALLPSTSMAGYADDLAAILEGWQGRD